MGHYPVKFEFKEKPPLFGVFSSVDPFVMRYVYRSEMVRDFDLQKKDWPQGGIVCDHAPELCTVYVDYGNGYWMFGEVCHQCLKYYGEKRPEHHEGIPPMNAFEVYKEPTAFEMKYW